MRAWRRVRPARRVAAPRRILVVQLDHLGDAVLTSPMLARLRAAYPEATIDVLASPSNREVFEADPHVDRVRLAARNWFERRPRPLGAGVGGLGAGPVAPGRGLRPGHRRPGRHPDGARARAGGHPAAGRLGDGRRRVPADRRRRLGARPARGRLAAGAAGTAGHPGRRPRAGGRARDRPRPGPGRPAGSARRGPNRGRLGRRVPSVRARQRVLVGRPIGRRVPSRSRPSARDEADWLHAGRFGASAPLLAVHLGAGTAAKRWPPAHWRALIGRFLDDGWRVVVVGGPEDAEAASVLEPHATSATGPAG